MRTDCAEVVLAEEIVLDDAAKLLGDAAELAVDITAKANVSDPVTAQMPLSDLSAENPALALPIDLSLGPPPSR